MALLAVQFFFGRVKIDGSMTTVHRFVVVGVLQIGSCRCLVTCQTCLL